jgi:hypothetical protein
MFVADGLTSLGNPKDLNMEITEFNQDKFAHDPEMQGLISFIENWKKQGYRINPEINLPEPWQPVLDPKTAWPLREADGSLKMQLRHEIKELLSTNNLLKDMINKGLVIEDKKPSASDQLDWTVLPLGPWNPNFVRRLLGRDSGTLGHEDEYRLMFVSSLGHKESHEGRTSVGGRLGDRRYIVFVFENHVVAESPDWGNALYVIKGPHDWRSLLRHSKRQVLDIAPERVTRILHQENWEDRLCLVLGRLRPALS